MLEVVEDATLDTNPLFLPTDSPHGSPGLLYIPASHDSHYLKSEEVTNLSSFSESEIIVASLQMLQRYIL